MGKAIFILAFLTGCASFGGYNLPVIQKEFQTVIQRNEPLVSKANGDYVEKKVLVEILAKSAQPNWLAAAPQANAKFEEMTKVLPSVNHARAQLSELNGQISALSYNRVKVGRDDEAYERADTIVHEFDTASKSISDQLNLYTRATNDLSDIIAENKLFLLVDIGDFQKRVQTVIVASNNTIREMNNELGRSERILNLSDSADQLSESQTIYEKMGASAKDFSKEAQKLPELSARVKESTMGNAKISSVDSNWPQMQKYMTELEGINIKLAEQKKYFNVLAHELQVSLKSFRK